MCDICNQDPCQCLVITPDPLWQARFAITALQDWIEDNRPDRFVVDQLEYILECIKEAQQ